MGPKGSEFPLEDKTSQQELIGYLQELKHPDPGGYPWISGSQVTTRDLILSIDRFDYAAEDEVMNVSAERKSVVKIPWFITPISPMK